MEVKSYKRPLYSLWNGAKFIWNNTRYTVFQHDGQMTEVFANGRFWAWPSSVRVNFIES